MKCNHEKSKVFTKRTFKNGSTHYCIQCLRCLKAVKLEGMNGHWLTLEEIPAAKHKHIREWNNG